MGRHIALLPEHPVGSIMEFDSTLESFTLDNKTFLRTGIIVPKSTYPNYSLNFLSGLTWNSVTLPVASPYTHLAYGNGMYVAIVQNSTAGASSPDGVTWTARTLPSQYWIKLIYANGLFIALNQNGTNYATSPDGITWTPRATFPASSPWYSVAYGNGIFIAVGQNAVATSPDGITWTTRTPPTPTFYFKDIAFANGLFVAVGGANGVETTLAKTTTDGITWTSRTLPSNSFWLTVGYGGDRFIALAGMGSAAAYSLDGITWFASTLPYSDSYGWPSIAYGNKTFVACSGSNSAIIATSSNGLVWTQRALPVGGYHPAVIFANSAFWMIGGGYTKILSSSELFIGVEEYVKNKYLRVT